MIMYLLPLFIFLAISSSAMDKPATDFDSASNENVGKFCAALAGYGKFSPNGQQILVAEEKETKTYWSTKTDSLHIFDIATSKKTSLENSNSADLLNRNTYGSSYHRFSWSPQGTLIRADYFTRMEQIVPGSYNHFMGNYDEDKIPLYVLKVWNTQGKLLYQRHHSPGIKPYFTANDQYLLIKEREEPLIVYDAHTGKKLAELGEPSWSEQRMPLDPHNDWIVQTNPYDRTTIFYDFQNFLPVRQIAARIEKFSTDGSLFLAEETKEYNKPYPETCISDHNKFLAYFCIVYNRHFQKIGSFNTNWSSRFDISPCQKWVTVFNHEREDYFDLESGNKKESFNRSIYGNVFEFLSSDCTQKLILHSDEQNNSTFVTLAQEGKQDEYAHLPHALNRVYYTRIPEIMALSDYDHIKYLFNTKTKTLTACDLDLCKGLYKHKPANFVNQEGYYITKAAPRLKCIIGEQKIFDTDTGFELRRLK